MSPTSTHDDDDGNERNDGNDRKGARGGRDGTTARWAPGDPTPGWVRGELVIDDAGTASQYAAHLADGYPVDPETLVAVASPEEA